MNRTRILSPAPDVRRLRAEDGAILTPPAGWLLLPPGDAGLTRRVKAAGPTWTVIEMRGRKKFSRGLWAPASHIEQAKLELSQERASPTYARRREADARRREKVQTEFATSFEAKVLAFLDFAPPFESLAHKLSIAVTHHSTPVGSGTVARTRRLTLERKAEAAVIAWMRHQTTAYDRLSIPRVKGKRRDVRRQLAEVSRALLDLHRSGAPHRVGAKCPLCDALAAEPSSSLED